MRRQLAPEGVGNRARLFEGQVFIDADSHLGVQPVAQPARPDGGYTLEPWDVLCRMMDIGDHMRFDAVEHSRQDGSGGLPNDSKDRNGDQKADDRVR